MRKQLFTAALMSAAFAPALASAQSASEHSVSGNMAIVSDYRYRGISQSFLLPAIQGGIDYSHKSGVYVGNWNSSVSGNLYNNGAGAEMDFYGGWKGGVAPDIVLDVGLLQYYYPGAKIGATNTKYDTLEAYIAGSWKWVSVKYSHTLSDFFGANDSKGSGYLDLTASYEVMPKLTLVGHIGNQKVKNYSNLDYTDYKLGVTYDLRGWMLGAAYISTNADKALYTLTDGTGKSEEIGKGGLVLSVAKSF